MKTNRLLSVHTQAVLVGAALALGAAAPHSLAQYGGVFVSATPQTPIPPGQSLSITVGVLNDTDDIWEPGIDLDFSWVTQVDTPSWPAGWSALGFGSLATVYPAASATMVVTLDPAELPAAPGNYSVSLTTAYNWWDLYYASMLDGNPKTVHFTIAAPNQAPVILPIGDKAVVETNLLSFTVTATNAESTSQTLTFNLEPGAPAGAAINPTNGLFTWTPPAGDGRRTNSLAVRVTDNGSPPLSDTNRFNVVVLDPPRFLNVSKATAGGLRLVWESFPGKSYGLHYKGELAAGLWTNLATNIVAASLVTAYTNDPAPAPKRFYLLSLEN